MNVKQLEARHGSYLDATADLPERKYLVSDSIRDCRTRKGQRIVQRVPARVGITGGYCSGAERTADCEPSKRVRGRNRRERKYVIRESAIKPNYRGMML